MSIQQPNSPSTTPNTSRNFSGVFRKPSSTYASATRGSGKVGKRKCGERFGLSPIDLPNKKHAFRELTSPTSNSIKKTPEFNTGGGELEGCMETSTPENDRPLRVSVQRRLFGGRFSHR